MSEAMKSEAIEDVLSSVRRLVSDNTPSQNPDVEIAVDRLVLTPELRVSEGAEDEAESDAKAELSIVDLPSEADDDADVDGADGSIGLEWSPDDRMANWDDVGGSSDKADSFEPEHGDEFSADETSGAVARAVAEARFIDLDPVDADQPETEDEAALDESSEPATDEGTSDEGTSDEGASDEDDALPDDLEQELAALNGIGDIDDTLEAAPEPETTTEAEPAQEPPVFARINRAAENPEVEAEASAEERVVEFGAQIDQASGDDALEDQVEDLGYRGAAFGFGDDDSVLDEEVLREIIAQVVREELQGVLGQRITRNVRKMVRREIRLALAAEELE